MDAQGVSARAHLESVWRQTHIKPKELEAPECPLEVQYVWDWFCELNRDRESTNEGQNKPLTSTNVLNWCTLHRRRLTSFELGALQSLDRAFLAPPPLETEEADTSDD